MISVSIIILLILLTTSYVMKGFSFFLGLFQLKKGYNHREYRVSVIIAARDEEQNIGSCLEALLNQSYSNEKYEIIVIDDQSTDNTSKIVASYTRHHNNIMLLNVQETKKVWAHKKHALSLGMEKCSGEIIMTTDADCVVGPKWIEEMVRYFEQDVGLVVGFSQVGSPRSKLTFFETVQAIDFLSLMSAAAGTIGRNTPLAASGQNLAYRKEAFHQVNGFERIKSRVSGDDVLLLQLIAQETDWNVRFAFTNEAYVTTQPVKTVSAFFHQRGRWASNSTYQMKLNRGFFVFLTVVLALNLLLCVTLPLSLFIRSFAIVPWICFMAKASIDFAVMLKGALLFQRKDLLTLFPLWEILHIPSIVLSGILGTAGSFTWKERAYRRQGLL